MMSESTSSRPNDNCSTSQTAKMYTALMWLFAKWGLAFAALFALGMGDAALSNVIMECVGCYGMELDDSVHALVLRRSLLSSCY